MRYAQIVRKTAETDIRLTLNADGKGKSRIDTGCGFLDHMLELFSRHGRFDIEISCKGDTNVDCHHTVEDVGIALGGAFAEALGDKKGVARYGSLLLPMDEALVACAVDLSGRPLLCYSLDCPTEKVGDFDTELGEEFFQGFVRAAGVTLHMKKLDGRNSHHILEAGFKAFARAMRDAVRIDPESADEIPSTKGIL